MMPCSTRGVLKQRSLPYFCCRLLVARNTPPKIPTSSPKHRTRSLAAIAISSASLMACSMFIFAILCPSLNVSSRLRILVRIFADVCLELFKLRVQQRRHFVVYIRHQGLQRRRRELLGSFHGFEHFPAQAFLQFFLFALAPPFFLREPVLHAQD